MIQVGPLEWDGTHIGFRINEIGAKTVKWVVTTKDGGFLGWIGWYGRWRKYSFFAEADCVFEETCLREIAQFVSERTAEHKMKRGRK